MIVIISCGIVIDYNRYETQINFLVGKEWKPQCNAYPDHA